MAQHSWWGTTDNSWNTAANWSNGSVPAATDDVSIPAGSADITSGLDQSAVALGTMQVEKGYSGKIGDNTDLQNPIYLQLNANELFVFGKPTMYVDLRSSTGVILAGSATPTLGMYGIYLKGDYANDLSYLEVSGNANVGLATFQEDQLGAVSGAVMNIEGGTVVMGVTVDIEKVIVKGGYLLSHSEQTVWDTFDQYGGLVEMEEHHGNGLTMTMWGGICRVNKMTASPNGPTVILRGGTFDVSRSALAKEIELLKIRGGELVYNGDDLTIQDWVNSRFVNYVGVA